MIADLTFCELREKEVVNIADGKKTRAYSRHGIYVQRHDQGADSSGRKEIF